MATSNELVDRLGVQTASLGLEDRALVPVQPEPRQGAIDPLGPLVAVALGVGVLDAQQERTALLTGEEPVEQGRAGASDVEIAGRRRREANPRAVGTRVQRHPYPNSLLAMTARWIWLVPS